MAMRISTQIPINNIRINRYINVDKFKILITEKYIWFNKLNNFSDEHEGRALVNWQNNSVCITNRWRESFVVNCWNKDLDENFALWNIYLGKENNGLCLVSNKDNFKKSLINENDVEGYIVNYVQYGKYLESIGSLPMAITKYEWYSYENEFRFLKYVGTDLSDNGIKVKVDPKVLIDKIILSPNIENKVEKEIINLCVENDIDPSIIEHSVIRDRL